MRRFYKLSDFKKYHESKNRRPLTSAYGVSPGEVVSVWDVLKSRNLEYEVTSRDGWAGVLFARPMEKSEFETIRLDIAKEDIYILNPSEYRNLRECECGARHTSMPSVHMFYCKLWTPIE